MYDFIPENFCSIRFLTQNFRNFVVEWKTPNICMLLWISPDVPAFVLIEKVFEWGQLSAVLVYTKTIDPRDRRLVVGLYRAANYLPHLR